MATCIRFFPSCKKTVLRESALKVSCPVSHKNTPSPGSLSPALMASEFVLVRCDGNSLPFTLPYDKPFKVLCQYLHAFEFQVGSKVEVTSSHRLLKVCHQGENPVTKPGGSRVRPQGDQKNAQGERTPSEKHGAEVKSLGARTPNQKPGEKTLRPQMPDSGKGLPPALARRRFAEARSKPPEKIGPVRPATATAFCTHHQPCLPR